MKKIKSKKKNAEVKHTRREFLKKTAGATTGLFFLPFLVSHTLKATPYSKDMSRVVMVKDNDSINKSVIDKNVVQIMMDAGIISLTGIDEVGEAWKSLFPGITSNSIIGIKVNCINASLSSHPKVAFAAVEGLKRMILDNTSFPENNIIIWDRTNKELRNAGYTINTGKTGVRCFSTNQKGVGYSSKSYKVYGSSQNFSRILTTTIDYLINLSVLKNHGGAGVTLSMKNHYGTCNRPGSLHSNNCNPYIPALNNRPPIQNKQVICITDALMGIISGGPGGPPQKTPRRLILSTDPVALDTVGSELLRDLGCKTVYKARYIKAAAEPPYNLGINDLDQIELINITSPSVPGSVSLDITTVTQGETFNISWSDWPGKVKIAIYKGSTFWMYAATGLNTNGSEVLDTSGWEVRDDYQIRIALDYNENVYRDSSMFSIVESGTGFKENSEKEIPEQFRLYQNYPNPFNPSTMISYQLKKSSFVYLKIYNLKGALVRQLIKQQKNAGIHRITWNGTNRYGIPVPSGIYIARLQVNGYSRIIKMQLLR